MSEVKPMSVPADPNVNLIPADVCKRNECNLPYREVVGSLMFVAIVSRPDIAYAVSVLSRFLDKHDVTHWRVAKRVFAYLIKTADIGIQYRRSENKSDLIGFSDADFASDPETRRSTTGYVFCMSGGPVTWSSHRQQLVTQYH